MVSDYLSLSKRVFDRAKYPASDFEIQTLASNMKLLDERGLTNLNNSLLDSIKKVEDTLSEHNFAAKLLLYHNKDTVIRYEPYEKLPPPDFEVVLRDKTYWIQMKRLSNLERENRQNRIIDKITSLAKNIQVGMFFGCELSEQFTEKDVTTLIDFLVRQTANPEAGKNHYFPNIDAPKAIIDFWYPEQKLQSLTFVTGGDMDVVNVTGLARKQIKCSLKKATEAFKWDIDLDTINFIAMDADNHEDIDLCNAVFGTEFDRINLMDGGFTWGREKDGFFCLSEFSKKIAGVIMLKRKNKNIIADYYSMLFINDIFKDRLDEFDNLLRFDKVISFNMRPLGKGNFDLS